MSDTNSPIDVSVIKGLVGDDEDVIKMFFNKFVDSVPDNIQEIKLAISNNDFVEAKAKAHKMKSSAKAIGANDLADVCQKIEDVSLQEDQSVMEDLFESILNEFSRCKEYIKAN